jgi:hypothetical protein
VHYCSAVVIEHLRLILHFTVSYILLQLITVAACSYSLLQFKVIAVQLTFDTYVLHTCTASYYCTCLQQIGNMVRCMSAKKEAAEATAAAATARATTADAAAAAATAEAATAKARVAQCQKEIKTVSRVLFTCTIYMMDSCNCNLESHCSMRGPPGHVVRVQ